MSAWLDNLMSDLRPQKRERAPFAGTPLSGDDWLEQLLMTAQPMDVVYPTIDTRGKAPIVPPDDSFHPIDALAAGVGMAEEHFGEITGLKNFVDEGRAMRERNMHQYEDNSIPYHLQNALISAPESLGIMAASTAAGTALGGPLGAAGGFVRGLLSQSPKIASALWNLSKAYQGGSTAAKIARTVVPSSPKVAASVEIGAGLEARIEQNEAEKRYIENAKRNGTYVEGQSEREAREIGNDVFWDNMGIISLFNAPQYNMIFGKPARNLLGTLGRFGLASGSEGAEEVAQEIASAHELNEPVQWRNVRDAGVAGMLMGGGMHAVGRGVPYAIDQITGQPTQEQLEKERKAQFKSYSDEIANRYANARENFAQETPDLQFDPRNLTRISETPASTETSTPAENPASTENSAPAETSTPEKISATVEDETTKNLLEQFAEEKRRSSEDATEVEFFDRMFTDKGKFRNTPENRAAIFKNFGDEFSAWRKQIETPAETQSADEFLSNPKLFDDARNLLANLREENSGAALELQAAIQTGDAATIEKFLRQYNENPAPVETPTPAENAAETPAPVENSAPEETPTSVENILALPAPKENSAPAETPAQIENSVQETSPPSPVIEAGKKFLEHLGAAKSTPKNLDTRIDLINALAAGDIVEVEKILRKNNQLPQTKPKQETPQYSSPLANAVQKFWNFPSTKLETPEAQKIYSLFTDWDAQGETSKPREFVDELKQLMTENESAPLPQLIEQARSKIETTKPVQPQTKRTNLAEMTAKVLATIPTDSFITEDEILDRIDDIEPSDLPDIMLKLELDGSVQERAGSFKRTAIEQSPQISQETLQEQEQTQPQPQTQSSQISPHEDTRDAFDLLPEVGELNDVESDETSAQSPQSVSEPPKTVIFRRNDKTSPDIPAGRKAIKEAPAGTKVRVKWSGLGSQSESNYVIGEKKFQPVNENGQHEGQAYVRNSANMRKYFGSSGVQEIELTYPQEANQNVTTQTTQTEENPRAEENSNQDAQLRQTAPQEVTPETNTQRAIEGIINQTRAEAYKILDVENHPHIKKRIDTIFAESRRNDKKDAEQLREKVLSLAHNIRDNNLFAKADFQAIAEDWTELKYSDYDKYGRKVFDLSVKAENGEVSYEDALKQIKEWRFGEKKKSTRKSKQSTKDALHAKLKTDTHPHLKTWLDRIFKRAAAKEATDDRKQAIEQLKHYEESAAPSARKLAELELDAFVENWRTDNGGKIYEPVEYMGDHGILADYRDRKINFKEALRQLEELKRLEPEFKAEYDEYVKKSGKTQEAPPILAEHLKRLENRFHTEEAKPTSATEKSKSDREAEIEKIISDATEEGHKILELDKYPEATDWFDSQVERGRRKRNITTVEAAEDYAKPIVEVAKSFRADKYYPKGILGGMLTRWLKPKTNNGDTALPEKYQATRDEAEYLINQAVDGRLTLDDAYAKMKSLLEENSALEPQSESAPKKSQGKWVTVMSSPSREELQKFMRKEFGNDTLTIQDDGTVFDEAHGRNSNYVVRTKNGRWQLGKYEDDSESAPKPKPETNDESDKFFLKHKNIYMDDTPYFGAAIKSSAFLNSEKGFPASVQGTLEKIAKSFGGRSAGRISGTIANFGFETAENRDRFIQSVMKSGILEEEVARREKLIREREEKIKSDAARQAEKDKILTAAKNEAYKILEANKYPEIKNWLDRQLENGLRKKNVETVAEHEKFAKEFIKSVKSYKSEGKLYNPVLFEVLNQWRDGRPTDSRGRNSRADSDKYSKARDIIRQADSGELTLDEAYAEMKHFLKTGRRTKLKPKSDADESIGKMNSALREASEKIINDAAKNPDVARALEQLGATVKNGKVTYPDDKTFQACVNLVNSGIVKSSQSGKVDTTIKNFVDPQDLNSFQRAFATFAKEMGVPIVFFRGNKNFHGAHANGISFYNADANFSHEFVYWHEFGHWLKNNQPELFGKLSDAANVTDEQIAEKKKSRTELSDEELREEIICDAMGDVARRAGIFQQFAKKNQSLIQQLMSWAKSTLDKFTDWFHTRERGLTTAQRAKMYDAFGKIARQIEDADGNKIFRYNNRTHEVELATGEKLPETKKALAELAISAWNDKNYNGKVSFVPSKKFRDKVQELFGHDVDTVFITADDVRHIKREHGESEEQRGQIDIKPENIAEIYDVVNDFDSATKERDDRKGNQNVMVVKASNGTSYVILVERGKSKAQVKTFYKTRRTSQMSDAKSPNLNAQSDSVKSSAETIPQSERDIKPKYSLDAGDDESIFRKTWNKFAKALHLNGDKIVTQESQRRQKLLEQEKAMADYLKEPTKENRWRLSKLGVTKAQLDAYQNGEEYATEIGLIQNYRSSPSRLAEKVATFRAFFRMGDRAMDKLVKLRDSFNRKYDEAMNFVKDKSEREQLVQLLWDGDEEQREFGKLTDAELAKIKADNPTDTTKAIQRAKVEKICDEADVSENVAKAYLAIRRQLERAYTLLDEARRRPQNYAKYLTAKQYERLRDNKFVKQGTLKIHDKQDADGNHLVTWTEYANTERKIVVDGSAAARFLSDDAIQILGERELEDGTFELEIREGIAPLNKLTGYVPHFFHQFTAVVRDADGKQVGNIIGTGKNQREAIKLAEDWQKNHQLKDGEQIFVLPHTFNFGMDENFTPVMGDKDFAVMMNRIAQNTGLPLDEAKQIVNGAVKLKSRHRFLGQLLHRKGYAGYEKDMDWVLRHHFNTAARYVALETEFKPKAISLFERVFGAFDKDHSKNLLAQYTKNFINDVNGVPAWIDEAINKTLNQNSVWRKYFLPNVGERGGQRIANSISARIAYLKLGMGNILSALINFTQLINAAGYVGWQPLMKHFGKLLVRRGKLTQSELRILNGSGVLQDIGLDTASGYDKNRGSFTDSPVLKQLDWVGQKSMWLFTKCDAICRASTALAAYENSIAEGKSNAQALDYAKKINRAANFSYGVEDAPNIFRRTSSVGKIGLQFYKYPLKQLEVIADFLPQNKKTTFKQKASFWIPYFFVCGLMKFFPFFDWGDKLLNEKFKLFPKDFLQKLVIQGTQEIFGKDSETGKLVGKVIMYGAPALANVDISGRTGLASIMPQETSNLLFGATGSTIYGVGTNLAQGNSLRALQSLSPGLYNIVAAIQGETRDARNRKISAYEEMHDRIVRGLGFKSVDESLAVDVQRINFNERDENKKRDQRAIDAYIEDPSPENLKRLKELGISGKRVKEERGKKNLTRLERLERNMTKAERKRNEYLLDFAR